MRNPELVSSSIVKSEEEVIETEIEPSENEGKEPSQAQTQELVANAADPLKERLRQHGSWSVYQYYVLSAGYIPVLMFVISAITVGFSTNFLSKSCFTECYHLSSICLMVIGLSSSVASMVGGSK